MDDLGMEGTKPRIFFDPLSVNFFGFQTRLKALSRPVNLFATWQMLYCGGSQPVVDALRGIERDFRVQLRTEKFDW